MRGSRKGKSDERKDYRFPVLLILALLILTRYGWSSLTHYPKSSNSPTEKEVFFRVGNDFIELLPSGEVTGEKFLQGEFSAIPQHIRPIFFLPISINKADQNLLQTIPGIGPSLSQAIIDYRQEQGRIDSFDELLEIRGIGPHTLEKITKNSVL